MGFASLNPSYKMIGNISGKFELGCKRRHEVSTAKKHEESPEFRLAQE
jgi:hypothetical protein